MKTIYIHVLNPSRLYVAVLVKDIEFMNAFVLMEVAYGRDFVDQLDRSKELKTIDLKDLPLSLIDNYEFIGHCTENFEKAWIHK